MKKGNPIRYITECCEHESKNKLKRVRIERNTNQQVCREHGGKLLYRLRICIDCGEDMKLNAVGPGGIRCDDCKVKERKRLAKIYNMSKGRERSDKRAKTSKWSKNLRGDYCKALKYCIKDKKTLNCFECLVMIPIFKGVDPGRTISA